MERNQQSDAVSYNESKKQIDVVRCGWDTGDS